MKKILIPLFLLQSALFSAGQDLPGPPSNIRTMPAGSYVIAMDNLNQGDGTNMNVKAYGLVVTLLNNNIKVQWVIRAGKVKDAIDFSVSATRIKPTAGSPAIFNFKAGPFVVFASDTSGVAAIVQNFNDLQSPDVNIYRTNSDVDVDVRYNLSGFKPKAALLDDGGNWTIHRDYLVASGVPASNYSVEATGSYLLTRCYTFASEPHNTESPTAVITDIRNFVAHGGNFLAQCHAVETYENNPAAGFIQTSTGTEHGAGGNNNADVPMNEVAFPNPDLSFNQFEGEFDMSNGGAEQNWRLISGSSWINNGHMVVNWSVHPEVSGASVSKLMPVGQRGGMVFYLGNHQYKYENVQHHLNGIRMYMNAFLTPSNLLGSISFSAVVTCLTNLTEPTVLRFGSASGPAAAYPLLFEMYADIKPPFGETSPGDVLLGSGTIDFPGDTGSVVIYTDPYRRNTNYVIHITPPSTCLTARDFVPNSCSSTLPVYLKSFTAIRNRSMVNLSWVTATELNCQGFEIQRAAPNGDWVTAGYVASLAENGNSSSELKYGFNEVNVSGGVTRYRLRQVDIDGNARFSDIRQVAGLEQQRKMLVYPNPALNGSFNIVLNGFEGPFDIQVSDANGRMVRQWLSTSELTIPVRQLPSGLYMIRTLVRSTGEQFYEKLIVTKQ